MATDELADAIHRDLFSDGRDFDELGWRGLWAYITKAPPNTAIFHQRTEGWTVGDHLAAAHLDGTNEMVWRYTAVNFKNGSDQPFPKRIPRPGVTEVIEVKSWETLTREDLELTMSPQVRALLQS